MGHSFVTVPAWYRAGIDTAPQRHTLDLDVGRISVRCWGDPQAPPLVLVHGGAAHAGWWDHIAPLLAVDHHVIAPDLSGHGDSPWREDYRVDLWRDELVALLQSPLVGDDPIVAGHSLGGIIAASLARHLGNRLRGVVIIDSKIFTPDEVEERFAERVIRPPRLHPTREALLARFRPTPPSVPQAPYTVAHIAEQSVAQVEGGWRWKFDPRILGHDWPQVESFAQPSCPILVVHGENGLIDRTEAQALAATLGHPRHVVTIAGSGHHVPIDQPVALASVIALAAAHWPARLPAVQPSTEGQP